MIPVYNTGENLRRCLSSLNSVLTPQDEIVIIDDGSTDSVTIAILDSLRKTAKSIRIFSQLNMGQLATRMRLIEKARNDYVEFVDSDDAIDATAYSFLKKAIESRPCDCYLFDFRCFDYRKRNLGIFHQIPSKKDSGFISKASIFKTFSTSDSMNPVYTKIIKKSAFAPSDLLGIGRITMGEDRVQIEEALQKCDSFFYVPIPVYERFFSKEGVTAKDKLSYFADDLAVYQHDVVFFSKNYPEFVDLFSKETSIVFVSRNSKRIVHLCKNQKSFKLMCNRFLSSTLYQNYSLRPRDPRVHKQILNCVEKQLFFRGKLILFLDFFVSKFRRIFGKKRIESQREF